MDNQTFVSGKIKNYNQQKGFGFIVTKEHGDVFFHQNVLESGFVPTVNQYVLFVPAPSIKKQDSFEATSVKEAFFEEIKVDTDISNGLAYATEEKTMRLNKVAKEFSKSIQNIITHLNKHNFGVGFDANSKITLKQVEKIASDFGISLENSHILEFFNPTSNDDTIQKKDYPLKDEPFYSGKIKFYDSLKGFGVITTQAKGEVFFHSSKLEQSYIPKENEYVLVQITPSKKKVDAFDASFVKIDIFRKFINISYTRKKYFDSLTDSQQNNLLQMCQENLTSEQLFNIWLEGFNTKINISFIYYKFSESEQKKQIFERLSEIEQSKLLQMCQEKYTNKQIFNIWIEGFNIKPNIVFIYSNFLEDINRIKIFERLNDIEQKELLKYIEKNANEEQKIDIWICGFKINQPSIKLLANTFIKSSHDKRNKILKNLQVNNRKELLDICQEEIINNVFPKTLSFSKKDCECDYNYVYSYIYNTWREKHYGEYEKYAKWIVINSSMTYYNLLIQSNKNVFSNIEFINDLRISENRGLEYKKEVIYKIYYEDGFCKYDDNLKWLIENLQIDKLKNVINIALGYSNDIIYSIYKAFFPHQNTSFFKKWGVEMENERLLNFKKLFIQEFEVKSNNLIKIKNTVKKITHSATDLANFTFCPASYAINQTYEVDFSEQENVFIGTQEHQKQRLIGLHDKEKWKSYKNNEKYANFYNDFERIINAEVVTQGHKDDKPKIYYSKNKKIASIPDYIFKDNKGYFVVEEKYTFKQQDKITNVYQNHKMQALAYLYGIADFDFDEAYLVYWFVVKCDNNYKIDSYKIFKIYKNEENKKILIDTFQSLEKLQNREEIPFDNQNINYKKCIKCNYFPYCEYKKGDKNFIKLPDI